MKIYTPREAEEVYEKRQEAILQEHIRMYTMRLNYRLADKGERKFSCDYEFSLERQGDRNNIHLLFVDGKIRMGVFNKFKCYGWRPFYDKGKEIEFTEAPDGSREW